MPNRKLAPVTGPHIRVRVIKEQVAHFAPNPHHERPAKRANESRETMAAAIGGAEYREGQELGRPPWGRSLYLIGTTVRAANCGF